MNTYLLLRDNKETGPYTQDQIVAKGLKPYDLVWVEGKSAAWRYPSEIPELKPYAPVVEEQPYDRFYKKPLQQDVEETPVKAQNYAQQDIAVTPPATEKQVVVVPGKSKKIYVTLPATANRNVAAAQAVAYETEKPAILPEKKTEAYIPKVTSQPLTTTPVSTFDDPPAANEDESFSDILHKKYNKHAEKVILPNSRPLPQQRERRRSSLITVALAACLLLGGIAIGFVLSNTTTVRPFQQDNNNGVAQQKSGNNAVPVNQTLQVPVKTQEVIPAPVSTAAKSDTIGTPPPIIAKKTRAAGTRKDTARPIVGLGSTDKTDDIARNDAPVKKDESPAGNEATLETAMKNIYQQVKLAGSNYRTGVLGGISDLHLTISNNSLYPLDQVEVEVKYLNPDKKVVKTQTMLFNDVMAGGQKVLEVPRTSRGIKVDYSITKIRSRALGIAHANL